MKTNIKKISIGILSLIILIAMSLSLIIIPTRHEAFAQNSEVYSKLFIFDKTKVTLQDYFFVPDDKKVDVGKNGLLLHSVNSGKAVNGTTIDYNGYLSGDFSMTFRVFSQETYQGLYPFIPHGQPGNPNEGIHYTYTPRGTWDEKFNNMTADDFNPYQDLKEVSLKFTDSINPNIWFKLNIYGHNPDAMAPQVSARVVLSTDDNQHGYGQNGNTNYNAWNACSTNLESTFSNNMYNGIPNLPVNIGFDNKNNQVYAISGGRKVVIRDISNNNYWTQGNSSVFGTLSSDSFKNGYKMSIEFADVVANNQAIEFDLNSIDEGGKYGNKYGYATLKNDDGSLKTYERFANMIIYSMNGVSFEKPSKSVAKQNTAVSPDGGILDSDKFTTENTPVLLTTDKTGDDAEGTTFDINNVFTNNMELDFRVFSEKQYQPLDPGKVGTHFGCWNPDIGNEAFTRAMADEYNPYLDLREIAITITSNIDSSKWVRLYLRGGYIGAGYGLANAVGAKALSYMDKNEANFGSEWYGYGLNSKGEYAKSNWDMLETTPMKDTSFCNKILIDNGQNVSKNNSSIIGFDANNLQFWVNDTGTKRIVRDFTNLDGVGAQSPRFGVIDKSQNPFVNGYTTSITFTQMTPDNFTCDFPIGQYAWDAAGYFKLQEKYLRHANMIVYSVKDGDSVLDNNGLVKSAKNTPAVNASLEGINAGKGTIGQEVNVCPTIIDVNDELTTYNGTITWKNTKDKTSGKCENNKFTPTTAGDYIITIGSVKGTNKTNDTAEFSLGFTIPEQRTITIVNEEQNVLAEKKISDGDTYKFEQYSDLPLGEVFIGYKYNNGLYQSGYSLTVKEDITLQVESIAFSMVDGASIRTIETSGHSYGLRFTTKIDQDKLAKMGKTILAVHGYILPTDMIEVDFVQSEKGLTYDLNFDEKTGEAKFAITSILTSNFNRKFSACAYMDVKYADGSIAKIYTPYDETKNAFSVNYIAKKALEDTTPNKYTQEEQNVFRKYINSVIELDVNNGEYSSHNADAYTIEKQSMTTDSVTLKVTFNNNIETFINTSVNPVRLAVTKYENDTEMRIITPKFISYENNILVVQIQIK